MTGRFLPILVVVAPILATIASIGCGSSTTTAASSAASWETQSTPVSYVVVCDVTRSTLWERDEYLSGLGRVLDGVSYGDHIVVMSAEDSSVENSDMWIEESVPRYSFSPSPRPDTDNQLLLDSWQKKQEELYRKGLDEFAATHDLTTWRSDALAGVKDRLMSGAANGSDLAGALYLAGQLLGDSSGKEDRRLVLFTDGLIQTPDVDWRSGKVTAGDVTRLVKRQRNAGSLPDLTGVSVTLIGARADDERLLPGLRNAWSKYVASCGGSLDPRFFMSHLSETLYADWMEQPSDRAGG